MAKSFKQMISLILVLCLCFSLAAPVMAASSRDSGNSAGGCNGQTTETEKSAGSNDPELILVEDETTVSEDAELRASTYALAPAGANSRAAGDAAEVSYSPASPTYAELASIDGKNMVTQYYWSEDGKKPYPVKVTRVGTPETTNNGCGGSETTTYYSYTLFYTAEGTDYQIAKIERVSNINNVVTLSSGRFYTEGPLLKYFPVTMLNYDQDKMNAATAAANYDATEFTLVAEEDMPTWGSLLALTNNGGTADTRYFYKDQDGQYYQVTVQLTVTGCDPIYDYSLKANDVVIATASGTDTSIENETIVSDYTLYDGGDNLDPNWNGIYFIESGFATDSATYMGISKNYSTWNYWTGYLDNNAKLAYSGYGNAAHVGYVYQGLVEDEFENGNIKFTVPDGGIFDLTDTSTKEVYTNVGLPFVYENGFYTFNAQDHSARFVGGAASNKNLTWNEGKQLGGNNNDKPGFFPFNEKTGGSVDPEVYHFGMVTTVPFSMTPSGTMLINGNEQDIAFSFAGDDDVWVFIDGKLVLDIGGIHDSIDGDINFGQNEIRIAPTKTSSTTTKAAGAFNKDGSVLNGEITDKLFNDENGQGILNMDIATFAATDEHTLTIYYLERGQNESNCKIRFNLPVRDSVSVKKVIEGQAIVEKDPDTNTETVRYVSGYDGLTDAQINVLNNQEFTFVLYKEGEPVSNTSYNLYDRNNQYVSTPSTDSYGRFILKNGETAKFITTFESSDSYFVAEEAKNGFIATQYMASVNTINESKYNEPAGGRPYYELFEDHYVTKLTEEVKTENDETVEVPVTILSNTYTVSGSDESEDSLTFICNNYMNASMPNPSAIPADDTIVIDYGLPVVVDLTANDMYLAGSVEVSFPKYADVDGVYTADFGTFTYDKTTESITYTLNEQLTGVEKIEYTLTGETEVAEDEPPVKASGTANVYIIPATSMYYEEDFGFVDGINAWGAVEESDYASANQEPGVVGTTNDSPYGSDVAYLNDSHDSNGTSKYVSTEDNAAYFSYTFTGTGTSFFARTTNNSAYINVYVYNTAELENEEEARAEAESAGTEISEDDIAVPVYELHRDTSYKTDDDETELYNIPVFTCEELDYDTYTVKVTISTPLKIGTLTFFGSDFWLDGIRVINPLNPDDANADKAESAYAADGEANMTSVTLRNKMIIDYTTENEDGELIWDGQNFVVFTDSNGEVKRADEYVSNGPKEEVYLYDGQSITFSLKNWDPNTNEIYIGIKAPFGSGKVSINGRELEINNATDCYYEVSGYAVITEVNGEKIATFTIEATDSLISLTNIKVTGSAEFTIITSGGDVDVSDPEGGDDENGDIIVD